MTQRELLQSQLNVLKSFVGIIESIIEKDDINVDMLTEQLTKMNRAIKCFIEVNALEL